MGSPDDFEPNLKAAHDCLLAAANYMAHAIDSAPEEYEVAWYWDLMEKWRETADALIPPPNDWGGNNVVRFPIERRG